MKSILVLNSCKYSNCAFLASLFFLFALNLEAKVEFTKNNKSISASEIPFEVKETFIENNSSPKVWGLQLKSNELNKKYKVIGGEVFYSPTESILFIGGAEASVMSENGQLLFKVLWTPELKGIVWNQCETKYLQLNIEEKNIDFPIAISCDLNQNPPKFLVSVPSEISWDDYSFEEIDGKGERWRLFNLPSGNLTNKNVGFIGFSHGTSKVKLPIQMSTLKFGEVDSEQMKQLQVDKKVGITMNSTKLSLTDTDYSSSNFSILLEAQTEKIFNNLKFGFLSLFPLGLTQGQNQIISQRSSLNVGYFSENLLPSGPHWQWAALGYYQAINYSHTPTSFSLQSSSVGFGLKNIFLFSDKKFNVTYNINNLGSKIFKSYSELFLDLSFPAHLFGFKMEWDFGLQNSAMTVTTQTSETSETRKISENRLSINIIL